MKSADGGEPENPRNMKTKPTYTPFRIVMGEPEPRLQYYALSSTVLAVAVPRVDGWTAYIKDVLGDDHQAEVQAVADRGAKLSQNVACALFPEFDPEEFCR